MQTKCLHQLVDVLTKTAPSGLLLLWYKRTLPHNAPVWLHRWDSAHHRGSVTLAAESLIVSGWWQCNDFEMWFGTGKKRRGEERRGRNKFLPSVLLPDNVFLPSVRANLWWMDAQQLQMELWGWVQRPWPLLYWLAYRLQTTSADVSWFGSPESSSASTRWMWTDSVCLLCVSLFALVVFLTLNLGAASCSSLDLFSIIFLMQMMN